MMSAVKCCRALQSGGFLIVKRTREQGYDLVTVFGCVIN